MDAFLEYGKGKNMKSLFLILLMLVLTGCADVIPEKTMESTNMTEMISNELNTKPDLMDSTLPTETDLQETPILNPLVNPKDADFVRVKDYIPEVLTELKYGTPDNFTGQVIYEFEDVFLRYGTVVKLKAVSEELAQQGLYLKIWDGFRPVSAQFKLWEVYPDPTYVANPNKGFSNHSRGYAVDITLVDNAGMELEMPTAFDDFSALADRDYSDCDLVSAKNAQMLETVMEKYGFRGYWGEWWHFNDIQTYDVEECFDPALISRQYTVQEAELLDVFGDDSTGILTIPAGEPVTLLGFRGEYSMVEYWGYRGYLPTHLLLDHG